LRLPASKWVTIGSCFGLFNQTAQIRCPVETIYGSHYDDVPAIVSLPH